MNRKKKPDLILLIIGVAVIIIGFSGIGYIPGRPAECSGVFALVMAVGVCITSFYGMSFRSYRKCKRKRTSLQKRITDRKRIYNLTENKRSAA